MNTDSFAPIMVTTTSDDREILNSISQQLLARKLAACVQISGPITSCYVWQGKTETSEEWLCTIKSCKPLFSEINKLVSEIHNYDQPELVAIDIVDGAESYLQWIKDSLKE